VAWATQREAELVGGKLPTKTLGDALDRFAREVSPKRKGHRWEVLRLGLLQRDRIASLALQDLTPAELALWRERRLRVVSGASVRREMSLLKSVLRLCRKEWGWMRSDPLADVDKPANPPSRKRRISQDEIDRITLALGYDGGPPALVSHWTALAFLFAVETAMRAGEILALTWADVSEKSVTLRTTKNGDSRRVPLSLRAREIIALAKVARQDKYVFPLHDGSRVAFFRAAAKAAGVADVRFHDARAEGIGRLSRKMDVLDLARVVGHRDPRSLMIYYDTDADELADRL
jgi:integrase